MSVTALFHYPVKGLRGVAVTALELDARGPRWDRHWMVVDAAGRFVSQRTHPAMATLAARVDGALRLEGPGLAPLEVPLDADAGRRAVTVWRDTLDAVDVGDAAAAWLSRALGLPCRLVRMADEARRLVDATYSPRPDAHTGFSDGYPVLVVNEASLEALNGRLRAPVPVDRFRPNVVVRLGPAWAEDGWQALRVGALLLDAVKPCVRCPVVTTDQRTGARDAEPLEVLRALHTLEGRGPVFGQNAVHRAPGVVRVGDDVEVLATP